MTSLKDRPMQLRKTRGHLVSNLIRKFFAVVITAFLLTGVTVAHAQGQQMMVRISEIEVDAQYLEQYKAILEDEAEASVRLEPGVVAIFPMYQRERDTEFRILEMYANREAYEAHLKTPHFQKYKAETLHMVKSLKLVDMHTLDAKTMTRMFKKMKSH
ncbi:MAG: antibiotic biosynthesis monooxygenase [Massilia sp.]|nr:antibiotic biosynthesis monooxygenase [Massilia sp.]